MRGCAPRVPITCMDENEMNQSTDPDELDLPAWHGNREKYRGRWVADLCDQNGGRGFFLLWTTRVMSQCTAMESANVLGWNRYAWRNNQGRGTAMRVFMIMAAFVAMGGCATGYSQFYQPLPNTEQTLARRVAPAPEDPAVERASGDWREIADRYARRGYFPLGSSSFNSGQAEDDDNAIEQAQEIGADLVVIIEPQHTETTTTSVPITTPTTTTSYTTGSATAYGSGGSATAYGNATTTTYGTKTTYIPMTVNRYDFGAMYFVKVKIQFGAYFRDLNDSERSILQTNKGAAVVLLVDGSPAYNSDVLVGDVILALDGERVAGVQSMIEMIEKNRGKEVNLTIVRGGNEISKIVPIGRQ